jgi:hypothetical protein
MHSSLAVTTAGLPLGLAAVKFWTRKKFKGTARLKKKINQTRVPIEKKESVRWLDNLRQSIDLLGQPERCIHIGDIAVLPPIGKQKHDPALDLTVIPASERGTPKGRKPIEWRLMTDLPVRNRSDAIENINWHVMRWKIEMFHKILMPG